MRRGTLDLGKHLAGQQLEVLQVGQVQDLQVLRLIERPLDRATRENPSLAQGVNIRQGRITNPAVAATFGLECAAE